MLYNKNKFLLLSILVLSVCTMQFAKASDSYSDNEIITTHSNNTVPKTVNSSRAPQSYQQVNYSTTFENNNNSSDDYVSDEGEEEQNSINIENLDDPNLDYQGMINFLENKPFLIDSIEHDPTQLRLMVEKYASLITKAKDKQKNDNINRINQDHEITISDSESESERKRKGYDYEPEENPLMTNKEKKINMVDITCEFNESLRYLQNNRHHVNNFMSMMKKEGVRPVIEGLKKEEQYGRLCFIRAYIDVIKSYQPSDASKGDHKKDSFLQKYEVKGVATGTFVTAALGSLGVYFYFCKGGTKKDSNESSDLVEKQDQDI